jgi:hypothetical protein
MELKIDAGGQTIEQQISGKGKATSAMTPVK